MTTLFPLNPEVNDLYQGYYWDGNFWKRSGEDAGFGYLEEAALQSTYLTQASGSTTYLTKSSASTIYLTQASASTTYVSQSYFDNAEVFPIKINSQQILSNYTIPSEYNAMSSGPIQINSSIYVEVLSGSTWYIV